MSEKKKGRQKTSSRVQSVRKQRLSDKDLSRTFARVMTLGRTRGIRPVQSRCGVVSQAIEHPHFGQIVLSDALTFSIDFLLLHARDCLTSRESFRCDE